jgi:hypothetical protein
MEVISSLMLSVECEASWCGSSSLSVFLILEHQLVTELSSMRKRSVIFAGVWALESIQVHELAIRAPSEK